MCTYSGQVSSPSLVCAGSKEGQDRFPRSVAGGEPAKKAKSFTHNSGGVMRNYFSKAVVCRTLTLLGLLLCALSWSFAQETTAGIQGNVKDQQGAVIKNATIEVSGPSLIGTRKVTTDDAGAYRVAQLPPGAYTITVSAPGFRSVRRENVSLEAGRLPSIDVPLEVGAITETIE